MEIPKDHARQLIAEAEAAGARNGFSPPAAYAEALRLLGPAPESPPPSPGLSVELDDELAHQPSRFNGDRNKEVEEAVTRGGLPWVSLRSSSFAINTRQAWGAQIRAGDVVYSPYAAFAEACRAHGV